LIPLVRNFENEWDKFGIRMSEEGEVKGSWLIHYSSPDTGFRCFDNGNNLVWVVKTNSKKVAIEVVNKKRLEILGRGLWGNSQEVRHKTGDKRHDL
jgi:hypothetical protein